MEMFVLPMSVLAAIAMLAPPAATGSLAAVHASAGGPANARRISGGAQASVTITVRIISGSARVGADFGPPLPDMTPRPATVTAADGSQVGALIYDFE